MPQPDATMPLLPRPLWRLACALLLATALGGCASTLQLDHQVDSHPRWASGKLPKAGDGYRFERLPSQEDNVNAQNDLENSAREALEAVGLYERPGTLPAVPWTVQISARSAQLQRYPGPDSYGPWPLWGMNGHVVTGTRHGGVAVAVPLFPYADPPRYLREVTLLVRSSASGQVVYETRARQEGPWNNRPALWTALFNAALDGFPQPPTGTRQVVVEMPR